MPSAGRPEFQKFSTSSGSQRNSSGPALSQVLQAPFAAPQRPGCAPELSVMDRTRLQVQRRELPRRIQGRTEESPSRALTPARRRHSPGSPWGRGSSEEASFSVPPPRGALMLLCSDPQISAPALMSTLPFPGGEFGQGGLHWCPLCCD